MVKKQIPAKNEENPEYIEKAILSYKRTLKTALGKEQSNFIEEYIIPLIEKVLYECPKEISIEDEIDKMIQEFSECIIDYGVVESTLFKKTKDGFIFELEGCIFANLTHNKLKKLDVACPLISVVKNIIQEKKGPYKEATSNYTKKGITCSLTYKK